MSKLFTIVGATGTGKTTVANQLFMNNPRVLAFDVYNYEYARYPEVQDWTNFSGIVKYTGAGFRRMDEKWQHFMSNFYKMFNATIIIEDATTFLKGNTDHEEELRAAIIARRHRNLQLVFLFHALKRVPPFIMEQTNYLILKKTGDNEKTVQRRFEDDRITKGFLQVRASQNEYETLPIKLL
jgi:guanylate kinase